MYQIQILIYVETSLIYAMYLVHVRPQESWSLNQTEIFNELAILYGSYYSFIYSADWMTNIDDKYEMGFVFYNSSLVILFFNMAVIFIEIIS